MTSTPASTTGTSRWEMLASMRRPTPGQAKIVSVMMEPPMSVPTWTPRKLRIGLNAFGSTCVSSTRVRDRPLDRAATAKFSPASSSTLARVIMHDVGQQERGQGDGRQDEVRRGPPAPEVGSQWSCNAKSWISSRPSQKLGIDCPATATDVTTRSNCPVASRHGA